MFRLENKLQGEMSVLACSNVLQWKRHVQAIRWGMQRCFLSAISYIEIYASGNFIFHHMHCNGYEATE